MILSIIIPVYNEAESIKEFHTKLIEILQDVSIKYEILYINDGSADSTRLILKSIANIKIINFSRNFGKEAALTAGLKHCVGDIVIPIDADFQDPPELINEMITKYKEGYDVVIATRKSREEGFVKKITAKIYYKLLSKFSNITIPQNTGDFRLISRKVVNAVLELKEKNRFMKGIFAWVGFKQHQLYFDRPARLSGASKTSWSKLFKLGFDGLFAFSTIPLRIWLYFGALVSFTSFIYALYLITTTIIYGVDVPGYASIMVAILFMGGIQLLSLGTLGEYIARVYEESKNRPIYIIDEIDET